jgi:phosphoribosylglycinamide formyltransferase-1
MVNIAVLISGSGTNLQAIIDSWQNKEINGNLKLVV